MAGERRHDRGVGQRRGRVDGGGGRGGKGANRLRVFACTYVSSRSLWTPQEEEQEKEEDFSLDLSKEERAALGKDADAKAMALYEEAEGMGRKLGTHHPETLTW